MDAARIATLFDDPRMLESRDRWSRAGFGVIGRSNDDKIMVAGHPSAPDFLFKTFATGISEKKQRKNFETRVDGIRALAKFVASRGLTRIALPQKWIVDLPEHFASRVLVVERLDLLDDTAAKAAYHDIDEQTLRDLCVVLHKYRGLDSGVRNVPLTRDGRVAFIDTERWDQDRDRPYLKRLREYLSSDRQKFAKKIFDGLG